MCLALITFPLTQDSDESLLDKAGKRVGWPTYGLRWLRPDTAFVLLLALLGSSIHLSDLNREVSLSQP